MFFSRQNIFVRYSLALLSVVLAVVLTTQISIISTRTPFALFFIAVIIATWFGGRVTGLTTLVLSTVVCDYFIIPPLYSFIPDVADAFQVATFFVIAFSLVILTSGLQQREKNLRGSEARYRKLFEHSPDGILIADPQSYYLDANETICKMLGYTRDEFIGLHASDILVLEEIPRVDDALETIKSSDEYHREWVFRRKDGSIFTGEVTATVMPDGNILGVIRDVTERIDAQRELTNSREQLSGIIGSAMDAIITINEGQQIVLFNAAAEKMFLSPIDNTIGSSIETLIPDRFRPAHQGHIKAFGKTNVTRRSMASLGAIFGLRSNGEEFPIEASISQLESGGEKFYTVILRDITERIRSEAAAARLAAIVQSSDDAIIGKDLNSIVTSWNKGAEDLFGYAAGEMEGTSILRLIPADRQSEEDQILSKIKSGQSIKHFETIRQTKSGSLIDVSVTASPIRDARGEIVGVSKVARDITDRKKAEEKQSKLNIDLARERGRLKNIVASVPGVVWEAWGEPDAGSQIDFVSDHIETMLCYSVAEWVSTPNFWLSIVHPDDKEKAAANAMDAFVKGKDTVLEFRWITKDGRNVWVETHTAPILDEKGSPLGMRGVTIDITERKNLEDQFRQSQKMEAVGLLAGGIAHDFNNLLTAINGYSDLTLKKISADDPMRRNIEEIRKAGDRAAALTTQLLAFSRKQLLDVQVHNVNNVVTEVEKMLHRIIRESVELRTVLDPELGNIKADPGQIEQVIINLAINARDAMPDGGTLTIQTENVFIDEDYVDMHITSSPGPYVRITITDTGEGMDDAVRQRIFEPFFTTKETGKGTGLGLSTVHGIIKQSGGNIHVYSEPGFGTTFKIYLPCVDESVEQPKWISDIAENFSGTETILLVEDEDMVRDLVREVLVSNGYNVLEAASGKAALAICETYHKPIDLLLTDMIMPAMGGTQLKYEVVKLVPDIKVLFMSGYTDETMSSSGALISGAAFIEKPFSPDGLARKIREVLKD